jgi:acid phosphatase type 7
VTRVVLREVRIAGVVGAVAAATAVTFLTGSGAAAPAARVSVAPAADTYVTAARKKQNFGAAKTLVAGPGSRVRIFMRFDLRQQDAKVVHATLKLYAPKASKSSVAVSTVTDALWSERSVTYANEPKAGARVALLRKLSRGWNSVDLTNAARGRYLISLSLTASKGRISLASRESGAHAPRLAIQTTPVATAPMVAAGDIAGCDTSGDEATAALVDTMPGIVAALGDLVYEDATAFDFATCYAPSWGRFKARTRPAAGNHEYNSPGAAPYYAYFGAAAGDPSKGYYSYDTGSWHVVVLNSNCGGVGGCDDNSQQVSWLRGDLAAHPRFCTLAYWHHPRFSSGQIGSDAMTDAFWDALYAAHADLVLVGHDHDYERFAPQTPKGQADPKLGLREFVVGTGGRSHFVMGTPIANSEVRNDNTFGVLRLTLHAARYDWQFVPVAGGTFTDSGSSLCH